jgi:hypothetical protein
MGNRLQKWCTGDLRQKHRRLFIFNLKQEDFIVVVQYLVLHGYCIRIKTR